MLTVLLGRGDGTFQTGSPYAVGSNPAFVIATDVNNDNIPDLVTANQSGNTFSVLLGNGDGTFKPSMDFVAGNSPRSLAAGDFNGDGRPDLAIVNFSDHTISVPLGNGDGTFQAARAYNVDLDRKSVAAGDLDGDGKPDLVVTNFCGTDATCASNGTVSVLLGVGDGTYKFAASYPLGAGPLSVALADVNGDKKLDLIAVNRGDKTASVLLGNGDGTFQSALTYPAGTSPISVAVGDFNKDSKPDLAIAGDCGSNTCAQPGEVSVLLGNGDGSFQSAATYAVGYSPSSIVAGDVNGDGNLDLAVSNACGKDTSCLSHGTATVLIGDGKGAFTSNADVQLGNSPSALTLGYLNGDGTPALVAAYSADNKVGVLLGNGDGTFKPQVTYQVGTAPSAVVVADFNGDGKRDVAVANFKDSKVSVLFGNGDGTLQAAVHYAVGVGPESLVAIDPNNSGHADLVSANGNGGVSPKGSDVTVLRNLSSNGSSTNSAMSTTSVFRANGFGQVTYGQELDFFSIVTGDGISGSPTGRVAFTVNNNSFDPNCDSVILQKVDNNSAKAVCKTTLLPAGSPTVLTATYSGDPIYGGSQGTYNQVVNKAKPTFESLQLIQGSNPSTYGDTLTFQATLDGASGGLQPTGNVVFTDTYNGTPTILCTSALNQGANNSTATCTPSPTLLAGSHSIVATYADDNNYGPADPSPAFGQTVNKAKPKFDPLKLIQGSNPSTYGDTLTFQATLTGASGGLQPTGNVVFTDTYNGIPAILCTSALTPGANNSTATCTPSPTLLAGSHSIVATYSDNANYTSADPSAPFPQMVDKAKPVFSALTSSKNPSTYGDPVIFTATLTGVNGGLQPTGNVVFTDTYNGVPKVLCTSPLNQGAKNSAATCNTPPPVLLGGTHNIVATYADDNNYGPAGPSAPLVQVVSKAKPVFSGPPTSSENPSNYGDSVTFTATLTGVSGDPQPTGNVVFTDTYKGVPTVLCTSPLAPGVNNSTATCNTPPPLLLAGSHSIVATYADERQLRPGRPLPAVSAGGEPGQARVLDANVKREPVQLRRPGHHLSDTDRDQWRPAAHRQRGVHRHLQRCADGPLYLAADPGSQQQHCHLHYASACITGRLAQHSGHLCR